MFAIEGPATAVASKTKNRPSALFRQPKEGLSMKD
jgi:hypothetical protein